MLTTTPPPPGSRPSSKTPGQHTQIRRQQRVLAAEQRSSDKQGWGSRYENTVCTQITLNTHTVLGFGVPQCDTQFGET